MSLQPYLNPDLSPVERARDIVSRLTLEEKCSRLRWDAPAIDRLGIPAYNWWNEALHGVGRNGRATVFPQAIGMAATFNAPLVERIASAISDEARAKHHEAVRRGSRQQYQGLTFWTPNINIFRDPRWGRGQETWGEDPFFTGEMGAAFVRGLQGDDPRYLKTAACAKHYAVHSGPEKDRHVFDACPPRKDFEETYLPAFKRLVDEGVESVMGAYNRVYGEPCCGSKLLLKEILRERWGFNGHIVSDCWAIRDFHTYHKVTQTAEESAALALKNGCDLNCGSVYCDALLASVKMGLCSEADVDAALVNLFRTQFKLGMFDPEDRVPYSKIPYTVVDSDDHDALSLEAALQSIVLLKNKDSALPVRPTDRYLVMLGPFATSLEVLMGNYFGLGTRMQTLVEGVAETAPPQLRLEYRKGFQSDRPNANEIDWSTSEAIHADVVVVTVGIDPNIEGEEGDAIQSQSRGDRVDTALPQAQLDYLKRLRARMQDNRSKARLVVLVFGGSHLSIPDLHAYADAVLQVWYPGQAGGKAIAKVLFGDVSPSGRMPITVPYRIEDLPPYEDYSMAGRTYRFMDEDKMLYPFGFGLSYSAFRYADAALSEEAWAAEGSLSLRVKVTNTGPVEAAEVVQVYVTRKNAGAADPHYSLAGFARVNLAAGASTQVDISLSPSPLYRYMESGERIYIRGEYVVRVGGALPCQRSWDLGAAAALELSVRAV